LTLYLPPFIAGINVDDLSTDMKAVTMATADAKEVTPRSGAKAASKEHAWSKEDDYF
jgi:hypothetical protein